jgi:hypothetical protein
MEEDPVFVRFDGASSGSGEFDSPAASGLFTQSATVTTTIGDVTATATRTATSAVSAAAASKVARQEASQQVARILATEVEPTYGAESTP